MNDKIIVIKNSGVFIKNNIFRKIERFGIFSRRTLGLAEDIGRAPLESAAEQ